MTRGTQSPGQTVESEVRNDGENRGSVGVDGKKGDNPPTNAGKGKRRDGSKKGKGEVGTATGDWDVEMHGNLFRSLSSEALMLTISDVIPALTCNERATKRQRERDSVSAPSY